MGLFDNTGLAPDFTPTGDIWPSTLAEFERRGIHVESSLSRGKIDEGATAVVLKATETGTNRVVAIKVYKNPEQQVLHRNGHSIPMTNFFENERRMLVGLQKCPAVPRYFYSVTKAESLTGESIQPFHVIEFIVGQRVTKFSEESLSRNPHNRPARLISLFRQVLQTIHSMHDFGYLHRDISDNNVLVDRNGQIRLIDLAEASPLGEEHTRMITTPGLGTDGTATKAQQKVRAIQTDDVNHACTIGYALFTGRWKLVAESPEDWQRNLRNSGAPAEIAKILAKGMKPRDTNRKIDPTVWNTAKEVDLAFESWEQQCQRRRRLIRRTVMTLFSLACVVIISGVGYWQFQQQAYTWNLNRLNKERIALGDKPKKVDARVQKHLKEAETLEEKAGEAHTAGRQTAANEFLQTALAEVQQAGRLADDLQKIIPLQKPLQAMLHNNQQWNTDCEAIRLQLTRLQESYLSIRTQIESGDPALAWQSMSDLQASLVHLIDDNQKSYEIRDLLTQFDGLTVGMNSELVKREEYQRILSSRETAEQDYFQKGLWAEARTAVLSEQNALQGFLQQYEDAGKKASRMAANVDLLNESLAANQALQKQLTEITTQLDAKQSELVKLDEKNSAILIAAAQDRTGREQAAQQLGEVRGQLAEVQKSLDEKSASLTRALADVEKLTDQAKTSETTVMGLNAKLKEESDSSANLALELARLQRELAQAEDLVEQLRTTPGINPADAKAIIKLAEAEDSIRQFNPKSWEEAQKRLAQEVAAYEALAQKRQRELAQGKTDKHKDVQRVDFQLKTQFRVVVDALRHRNQADLDAWQAFESEIIAQHALRSAKITEGWDQNSETVRDCDTRITELKLKQQPYDDGKLRHEKDDYQFASWSKVAELPDIKFARAIAQLADLKLGSEFTNSVGQKFVYLPPGTFEMGSPTNEAGRDSDEGVNGTHTVMLTSGYFIAIHENTQAAYETITGDTPWTGESWVHEGPDFPATYVSWDDANDKFIKKLNQREREAGTLPPGWEYRLPTEAQWEYAARAGTNTRFSFGDDETELTRYAWFVKNAWDAKEDFAHQVGQKLPNKWGLYDMLGNCWEWTSDYSGDYTSVKVTDPPGPTGGSVRVYRGGSFQSEASGSCPARRDTHSSGYQRSDVGFRPALVQVSSP